MMRVDWQNISAFSDVPPHFRLMDRAEISAGCEVYAWKAVSSLDWYFDVHFPDNPVMPGVFLMEMLRQTAVCALRCVEQKRNCALVCVQQMRMFRPVRPGDFLRAHVSYESPDGVYISCAGIVEVFDGEDGALQKVCAMRFMLAVDGVCIADDPPPSKIPQMEKDISIGPAQMARYIADPPGYRFVDVVHVMPGCAAEGRLALDSQAWYLQPEISSDGTLSITFLMEAIMQTGVFCVTTLPTKCFQLMMFHACQKLSVYRRAMTGETLHTRAQLHSYRNGVASYHGSAHTERGTVCTMNFVLVAPEDMAAIRR